jgi:hypothetical protein
MVTLAAGVALVAGPATLMVLNELIDAGRHGSSRSYANRAETCLFTRLYAPFEIHTWLSLGVDAAGSRSCDRAAGKSRVSGRT